MDDFDLLELVYEQVGRGLAGRSSAQTTVAAGDIGALGYYSRARNLKKCAEMVTCG